MSHFLLCSHFLFLTYRQRDHSRRQERLALPQLAPPTSSIVRAHFLDGETGRRQTGLGRSFRWGPPQLEVRGQRWAHAARQVELLAREEVCSWGGGDWGAREDIISLQLSSLKLTSFLHFNIWIWRSLLLLLLPEKRNINNHNMFKKYIKYCTA